jgi:hypothetical protein
MFDKGTLEAAKIDTADVIKTKLKITVYELQSVSRILWQINNNKYTTCDQYGLL